MGIWFFPQLARQTIEKKEKAEVEECLPRSKPRIQMMRTVDLATTARLTTIEPSRQDEKSSPRR